MPYKDGKRFTIAFNRQEADLIEKQAAIEGLTPYALLKMIVCEALGIKTKEVEEK